MKWRINGEWSIANLITIGLLICSLLIGAGIAKGKIEKIDKKVDKEPYEQRMKKVEKDIDNINNKIDDLATKNDLSNAVDLILNGIELGQQKQEK